MHNSKVFISSYFDGDPPESQNNQRLPKTEPKEEKQNELETSVKTGLNCEKDLQYLCHYVQRQPSLDEELKKDLQKKIDNQRYLDMLVSQKKTDRQSVELSVLNCFNLVHVFFRNSENSCHRMQ